MGLFGRLFGKKTEKAETMKMEPGGAKEHGPAATASKVKDPVCGMEVDPKTAAAKSEHMGKSYYFCAVGCKKEFDKNPSKYVQGKEAGTAGNAGGQHQM